MKLSEQLEEALVDLDSLLNDLKGTEQLAETFCQMYSSSFELPVSDFIMILGSGSAGKDTAAGFFVRNSDAKFVGSSSTYLCNFIVNLYGLNYSEVYTNRHSFKQILFRLGNCIRNYRISAIPLVTLSENTIVSGLRDRDEVEHMITKLKPKGVLYIERDVPEDVTMTFTGEDVEKFCMASNVPFDYVENINLTEFYANLLPFVNQYFTLRK